MTQFADDGIRTLAVDHLMSHSSKQVWAGSAHAFLSSMKQAGLEARINDLLDQLHGGEKARRTHFIRVINSCVEFVGGQARLKGSLKPEDVPLPDTDDSSTDLLDHLLTHTA